MAKTVKDFEDLPDDLLHEIKDDDFGKIVDENQSNTGQNSPPPEEPEDVIAEEIIDKASDTEQIDLGEFFEAEDLTEFEDLIMTPLSGMAFTAMKLDYEEKDIAYSASNKRTLNKINAKVLKYLKVTKINPLALLLIALLLIPLMKGGRLWINKKMLEDAEKKGFERGRKSRKDEEPEDMEYEEVEKKKPAAKKTAKKKPVSKKKPASKKTQPLKNNEDLKQ